MSSASSNFLPHVNGVRALAILGVLIYHLNADYCPSGYFGVDVFLVISGYFLFRSMMNAEKSQQFHYGRYLLGKGWRILPSWFACCLTVVIVSGLLMLPYHAIAVFNTAGASSLFVADYYIDHLYDYFNDSAHLNALLHLWYLSITVQLYVIAPILVMPLVRRGGVRAAQGLLVLLGCLSLGYYILTTCDILGFREKLALTSFIGAESIYYHLIPRLWEIVAGYCVLFLPALEASPRLRFVLALFGLVGIVVSFFLFSTGSPSGYVTVVSCMLLLRYGNSGPSLRILAWKPVQFLGTISFSLFLWHWPVMVFWKYFCFAGIPLWGEVSMLLLSLILGYVAWRWIESASIPGNWRTGIRYLGVLACIPALLFVVFCGRYALAQRNSSNVSQRALMVKTPAATSSEESPKEGFDNSVFKYLPAYCGEDDSLAADFLIVGDSHAGHLYPGVHQACSRYGIRGIAFNNSVVPFWNCFNSSTVSLWTPEKQKAFHDYLLAHPQIKYVLISLRWKNRVEYGPYDLSEYRNKEKQSYMQGLKETCSVIRASGAKVILLADTPDYPNRMTPLQEWGIRKRMGMKDSVVCLSREEHRQIQQVPRRMMETLLAEGDVHAVVDLSVPMEEDGRFPSRKGDVFLVNDSNHLTPKASEIVGNYLVRELVNIMNKDEASEKNEMDIKPVP